MDTDEKSVRIVEANSDYLFYAFDRIEMLSALFEAIADSGDELHLTCNACSGIAENLKTASRKIMESFDSGWSQN